MVILQPNGTASTYDLWVYESQISKTIQIIDTKISKKDIDETRNS